MPSTLSPFRYPGGKSQLYPFVSNLINLNMPVQTYIEPFAGGSGIGLKLLLNGDVTHIVINDYDPAIYSVWWAIINHPNYLIEQIMSVPFDYYNNGDPSANIQFWKSQHSIFLLNRRNPHSLQGAFATLFLNRTNRSGIILGGPLGGWSQGKTMLGARLNKKTLVDKIRLINAHKDSISISNKDAIELIPTFKSQFSADSTFIFFDPPYFEQGSNLYFSSLDEAGHRKLAESILSLSNYKWIVTYDRNPLIQKIYSSAFGRYEYFLNYSANSKNRGKAPELLFSSPFLQIESFGKTKLITQ